MFPETFRSLEQSKEKKAEDTEFEQLRQASIKAALRDGEGEKKKTFGGKNVRLSLFFINSLWPGDAIWWQI